MELSVVVPTLNGRETLAGTLDSIATRAPDTEVIVVNGPSTDGTTGMVRERDDVDVLVEIADRSIDVARNVGLDHATGDAIALLAHDVSVTDGWLDTVRQGLDEEPVVTGPTHQSVRAGMTTERVESRTIAGRSVTYVNPDNVTISRRLIDDLDGFDEYLDVDGTRDLSHRIAGCGGSVAWKADAAVERSVGADGGSTDVEWAGKHRSRAYRLTKNYGLRPGIVRQVCGEAGGDARATLREVFDDERSASAWLGSGRSVLAGIVRGTKDGLIARARDRTERRNPHGRSTQRDRAVTVYDDR